jgi:hypothetical protein
MGEDMKRLAKEVFLSDESLGFRMGVLVSCIVISGIGFYTYGNFSISMAFVAMSGWSYLGAAHIRSDEGVNDRSLKKEPIPQHIHLA